MPEEHQPPSYVMVMSKCDIVMKITSESNEGSQGLDCVVAVEFEQN